MVRATSGVKTDVPAVRGLSREGTQPIENPKDEHVGSVPSETVSETAESRKERLKEAAQKTETRVVGSFISATLSSIVKLGFKAMDLFKHGSTEAAPPADAPVNFDPPAPGPDLRSKLGSFLAGPAYPLVSKVVKLPLTRYDTPEIIAKRAEGLESKHDGTDPEGSTLDIRTPEKVKFRQDLVDQLYGKGAARKEREAWVMIGMPACGKSTVSDRVAKEHGAMDVDGDDIRDHLPEWHETHSGRYVNDEKKLIQNAVIQRAAENGDNLIFQFVPGIGIGDVTGPIEVLKANGYKVHLFNIELPTDEAIGRSIHRFEQTGRFVDPLVEVVLKDGPKETFEQLKDSKLIDDWTRYSTDVPLGHDPILLGEGVSDKTH